MLEEEEMLMLNQLEYFWNWKVYNCIAINQMQCEDSVKSVSGMYFSDIKTTTK